MARNAAIDVDDVASKIITQTHRQNVVHCVGDEKRQPLFNNLLRNSHVRLPFLCFSGFLSKFNKTHFRWLGSMSARRRP